ncbi:MAG: lipopolysaccharide biosynthesis protein [Gammaproteobacteria bacterium]|nr:MAG: lipopolysaccharide biosynthesis protein [Gammaproteobacteria bacterium]
MTKPGTLSRSFLWATSGTVLQTGAQLIALVALARLLTPFEFGVATIATLVTQLCLAFSEFGVAPFIVHSATLSPSLLGSGFLLSCLFGIGVAVVVWLMAPLLGQLTGVEVLIPAIRVLSVVFLIRGWSAVQESLCQRELDFRFLARVDGWSFGIGYAVVAVGCAMSGLSYWSVIIGQIGQAAIRAALLGARHRNLSALPSSFADGKQILKFGVGQTFARFGSYVGSQADSYLVAAFIGVVSTGHYGRANQLVTMPSFYIGQVFDRFVFPVIARLQGDTIRLPKAYLMAVSGASLISVPMAVLTWLFADAGVSVILGKQWSAAVAVVQILALAVPFRMLHKVADPTARALGATYTRAWRQWLFAAMVFSLGFVLLSLGINGVAWAVVVSTMLDAMLMTYLCCRLADVSIAEVLRALVPATRIGMAALVLGGATHAVGVAIDIGSAAVLLSGVGIGGVLLAFVFSKNTGVLLGRDGEQLISVVRSDIRSALR